MVQSSLLSWLSIPKTGQTGVALPIRTVPLRPVSSSETTPKPSPKAPKSRNSKSNTSELHTSPRNDLKNGPSRDGSSDTRARRKGLDRDRVSPATSPSKRLCTAEEKNVKATTHANTPSRSSSSPSPSSPNTSPSDSSSSTRNKKHSSRRRQKSLPLEYYSRAIGLDHVSSLFSVRTLSPTIELQPFTADHIPEYRSLNKVLLPVSYSPNFYRETIEIPDVCAVSWAAVAQASHSGWSSGPSSSTPGPRQSSGSTKHSKVGHIPASGPKSSLQLLFQRNSSMPTAGSSSSSTAHRPNPNCQLVAAIRCILIPWSTARPLERVLYISTLGTYASHRSQGIAANLILKAVESGNRFLYDRWESENDQQLRDDLVLKFQRGPTGKVFGELRRYIGDLDNVRDESEVEELSDGWTQVKTRSWSQKQRLRDNHGKKGKQCVNQNHNRDREQNQTRDGSDADSLKLPIRAVMAHVWVANEDGLAFYHRLGFEDVVELKGYYPFLTPPDAILVRKTLK